MKLNEGYINFFRIEFIQNARKKWKTEDSLHKRIPINYQKSQKYED